MKKRILATLLSLVMVIGLLPTVVLAEGNEDTVDYSTIFTYTTTNNEVTITGFNSTYLSSLEDKFDIALTIPATIKDNPVVAIGEKAFAFSCLNYPQATSPLEYSVSSLSFENAINLKSIGTGAFAGFTATGTLTFPDTCSEIEISDYAFTYSQFETFEASPNTIKSIGTQAFNHANNLSGTVVIPEGVTTLGGTVFGSTNVEIITLPSTITSIGTFIFNNMNSLKFAKLNFEFNEDITIPDLTSNGFMGGGLSSNSVLILKNKDSYDYIYSNTYSANQALLAYEMTLTFDGLDSNYDREVLYNHPINWEKTDTNDDFSWSEDESYFLPTLETGMRWSFTNEAVSVSDTLITAESNVSGNTLYAVDEKDEGDVRGTYTYFEFGTYPQTQLCFLLENDFENRAAFEAKVDEVSDEFTEQGIEFVTYDSGTEDLARQIVWFEVEPIMWRVEAAELSSGIYTYALWSEYVLDVQPIGEDKIYADGFDDTPLYAWLNDDFTTTAFAGYEEDDFTPAVTLVPYHSTFAADSVIEIPSIVYYGTDADRLKAWRTGYADYFGAPANYWLSCTYTSSYAVSMGVENSTGVYVTPSNSAERGVRPLMYIHHDTDKYITSVKDLSADASTYGSFENPYKFILIETVSINLEEGSYDEPQEFKLSFSDDDADIIYKLQIDDGEEQVYDPDAAYYISKDCTVTAWAVVDGVETAKASWDYIISNPNSPDLSQFNENEIIIVGNDESTPDNFDIIMVPGIESGEQTSLEEEMPSGYEYADGFHLYATVNGKIIEDATFTDTVKITLSNELDSTKTYQLLHLKDGNIVDTFSEEDDTLTVNPEENSISFEFDVRELSPFMLVSKMSTSSGSSNVGTVINLDDDTSTSTTTTTEDDDFPFIDVDDADYYYDAVAWAVEQGITTGKSATIFAPADVNTRAEAVTFLWRAMGSPESSGENPFEDLDEDAYYYEAVLWAIEEGITIGTSNTTFSPYMTCSRAHIVTFLWRMAGEPNADTDNIFDDVSDDDYYFDAVLWAVLEEITNGTDDTIFAPNNDCTRAQIVTFLYRYFG